MKTNCFNPKKEKKEIQYVKRNTSEASCSLLNRAIQSQTSARYAVILNYIKKLTFFFLFPTFFFFDY